MLRKHNLHETIREAEQNPLDVETEEPEIAEPETPMAPESAAAQPEFIEPKTVEPDPPKENAARFSAHNHDQRSLRAVRNAPFRY
jgi:hypothetical protein